MVDIDLVSLVSQTGFPIAVAVYLLWKGYTQDKEYLVVMQQMLAEIREIRKEHDRITRSD